MAQFFFLKKNNNYLSGEPLHLDPAVVDCVLLAARRNHSADVTSRAAARKIRALHHDPRHVQVTGTSTPFVSRWH